MKTLSRIFASIGLALLLAAQAHAAIGLGSAAAVYGSTSGTAFASSVPAADVIVVFVKATSSTAPTVTDNVNSGNYSELNSYAESTNSRWMYVFFKVANASGTPTVSVSGPSGNIIIVDFTGFTGTPTADSTPNGGTGSASASTFSVSPVTAGFNNELIVGVVSQLSNIPSTPSGWTELTGFGGALQPFWAVIATSGTDTPFSASLNTTTSYDAITAGLYGLSAGGSSQAPLTLLGVGP